jgi:hypothetical protein
LALSLRVNLVAPGANYLRFLGASKLISFPSDAGRFGDTNLKGFAQRRARFVCWLLRAKVQVPASYCGWPSVLRAANISREYFATVPIALGMSRTYIASAVLHCDVIPPARTCAARSVGAVLVLTIIALTLCSSVAQANDLFGAGLPTVIDSGNPTPVELGVKIFSDVPGQVLGCSFYKSPANTGTHVISLWDSAGKLLASKVATGESASGKQVVLFSSPVAIAAKQTFVCGYFAPSGHYSYTRYAFTTQKDVPPLHVPVNGGMYTYGPQSTVWPTNPTATSFSVDVLFAPSATWISKLTVTPSGSGASISWTTAVPSDSQVEYGPTTAYGNSTPLATTGVTAHTASLSGLAPGTTYHLRVRSRDSDGVLAVGLDTTLAAAAPAVIVALSPSSATIASSATQQFMATVSNTVNPAVTWSATAGSINSSGMFIAPSVSSPTSVTVTATSQADPSKSASAILTVNPAVPVLSVSPASLSFTAQSGSSTLTSASVSITNTGAGSLTFTAVSDQPWLTLSANSGTAPSTLQVRVSATGLKAGTYTGRVTLSGAGVVKTVTVALTITSPLGSHSVALSWMSGAASGVSYSLYRSTNIGGSYGLLSSAIGGATYSDPSVQSGTTYYYVVTAVDSQGRESGYSNEIRAIVP